MGAEAEQGKRKWQKAIMLAFTISSKAPRDLVKKMASSHWCNGKESICQCRRCKRHRFNPWVRKIPWSRKWRPTPVFLPGEFHGQRSLVVSSR